MGPLLKKRTASRVVAAVAIAASILMAAFVVRGLFLPASAGSGLEDLVTALKDQRQIEPRLTGGFHHAPMRSRMRSTAVLGDTLSPDLRIAVARIEKEAAQRRTEMLRPLGIAYLSVGEVDKAVAVLEESSGQTQYTSWVLSDLAAAYLVRATTREQPHDLAKALSAADRAAQTDPTLAEALFNRAVALERLALIDQARQAWDDYLNVDNRSEWAGEARSRQAALKVSPRPSIGEERNRLESATKSGGGDPVTELVKQSPHAAREWVEEHLLVTWPGLVREGRFDEARTLMARVAPVADAIAQQRGDYFLKDAVSATLEVDGDRERLQSAAAAHQTYKSALNDYQEDRIGQSARTFLEALPVLSQTRSSLVASARFYRAVASYYSADLKRALAEIDEIESLVRRARYIRLLGLVQRMKGLIHVVQGRYGDGLNEYQAALRNFEAVADFENEAGIHASLAETLDFVGERQLAWNERYGGLSRLGFVHDSRRRHTILQGAAVAALRQELPETALYFQHAALDNASRWARPPAIANVLLNRAEVYERLGRSDLAEQDLTAAEATLGKIDDPTVAARTEARIQLARGQTIKERQPNEAIRALDSALKHLGTGGASWPLARVHLARGRAYLRLHQDDAAEAEFLAGITVFERMRASLTSEALRSSYFEQPWDLFTEMIRMQVGRRRPDRALNFAEQARARTLLEAVSPAPASAPVDPSAIRTQLPDGITVLYYASLDERLLIWVLSRARLEFVETAVPRAQLRRLVERYRDQAPAVTASRNVPSLEELYDALIRPAEHMLQKETQLVVVPDDVLHAVPFAALLRRENQRYLVEDHSIQVTPSMTVFHLSSEAPPPSARDSALIVGNPRAGSENTIANLPAAESEARDIARMYQKAELLLGREATKTRFLASIDNHDIVHFAGHAIPNEEYPGLSRLLFSGEADADTLFVHEIGAKRFHRTRLVVLAACRTNAGRIRRGEGVFSLARPFIAAGVPNVVASLTDVDDRASYRLFVAFHRALARGESPVAALRSAQLTALADRDPSVRSPATWGSFAVIGRFTSVNGRSNLVTRASGTSNGKNQPEGGRS